MTINRYFMRQKIRLIQYENASSRKRYNLHDFYFSKEKTKIIRVIITCLTWYLSFTASVSHIN